MTFIPFVPIARQEPSPNAKELGRRIEALIQEYRLQHPDTSQSDVGQALRLVQLTAGGLLRGKLTLMVVLGIVSLIGGLLAYLNVAGGSGSDSPPMMLIVLVIVGAMALVWAVNRSRG